MTFLSITAPTIEQKDIVLIGDCPSAKSLAGGKPFDVSWEGVLEQALHMAGLTKSDVSVINLFPESISTSTFWQDSNKPSKRYFKPAAQPWLQQFREKIELYKPKVIVPLGQMAVKAILNRTDYTDIRGYPFRAKFYEQSGILYKETPLEFDSWITVIPSLHPRDMVWSNYLWRFYLSNDLKRAKDFADGKLKIVEPTLHITLTADYAIAVIKSMIEAKLPVAFDIEVSNYEVSCIGVSNTPHLAYTIPFDDRWSEEDEVRIWLATAALLQDPEIPKILQNGIFDTYFLAYKMGIITRGVIEDTMIGSSVAYPDFLKGLGFLGSVHTTYTYWKDQADFKSIKKED